MSLDYGHTCPDINKSIAEFKSSDIERFLSDMVGECCPMLAGKQKSDFVKYYVSRIYEYVLRTKHPDK